MWIKKETVREFIRAAQSEKRQKKEHSYEFVWFINEFRAHGTNGIWCCALSMLFHTQTNTHRNGVQVRTTLYSTVSSIMTISVCFESKWWCILKTIKSRLVSCAQLLSIAINLRGGSFNKSTVLSSHQKKPHQRLMCVCKCVCVCWEYECYFLI